MIASRLWWFAASLAEPGLLIFLRLRLLRGKEHPDRVGERRGRATLPRPEGQLLWLHAASVGESVSVLPLLEALCRLDDGLHILITTGSLTSQRLLTERLAASGLADRVLHQFVPLDVPRWVNRFLRHWYPSAMALVESELWPNLIACADAARVPMALVNGRLSARSLRGWQRLPRLARATLSRFRWIAARSDEDARRFTALGAAVVDSPGDLKAAAPELPVDIVELQRLRRCIGNRPLLLAACTHAGEETVIADARAVLVRTMPRLLTVIAPRHPARGAAIAAQLDGAPRRSLGQDPDPDRGFWVCDSLGEMGLLYRLARVAFIGNSLDGVRPGGGHNPYEPARLGCAVATGPRSFNFADAVETLRATGAIEIVASPDAVALWAAKMLDDPEACDRAASAGHQVATAASDVAPTLARRLLALCDDVAR
ncbi:3-deoxy-D-manno-octulosonic acid transferase [Lichenicoccus sp.]|uniref:3-deoxy-D-manno-octulosonic acid transferase n=1 Tax=Lichenicoccus sp. TaxID=2781899 RepID=UPI003D122016